MFSLVVTASLRPKSVTSVLSQFAPCCVSIAPRLWSSSKALPPFLHAQTVNSLLMEQKNLKFVDVRAPEVYSKGHIPDAVNIHDIFTYLSVSNAQDLQGERNKLISTFENLFQQAGISGDEVVVTYEDNLKTLYGASRRGFFLLKLLGHPNVAVLNGGFEAWVNHGLPTSTTVPDTTKGAFRAQWVDSLWSDRDDVAGAIKDDNTVLLDVRDTDEWKGMDTLPSLRKGRLPGAIHIHWHDFLKTGEDGMTYFREPEEVREMCAAKGLTPESKVILYCFSGVRASSAFIALKEAGFSNVTNYIGSWYDWSSDSNLEIDSRKLE